MSDVGSKRVRPKVFIGSSTEGMEIAESLQVNLDYDCEARVWSQGVFEPGGSTLPSLVHAAQNADFAILVVSPNDQTLSRGTTKETARDNVIFELGLFMGVLGKERTFMVYNRNTPPDLPSDLLGVTSATYAPHSDGNIDAAMGAPTTQIRRTIQRLGIRGKSQEVTSPTSHTTTHLTDSAIMERIGKLLVQVLWTSQIERGDRLWEQLAKIGAPPALTNPIQNAVKYEADVKVALDSIMLGSLSGSTLYANAGQGGVSSEFTIATSGGNIFVDLAPDLFIANGSDTIEVTINTRLTMLRKDSVFIGQVLVAKDVDMPTLNEVRRRLRQDYNGASGDVRIVHYRNKNDVGLLLQAIHELLAKAPVRPVATATSADSEHSDYTTTMLGVLVKEVLDGPAGRYLRLGTKNSAAKFSNEAHLFLERTADGRSISIDIRPGLYRELDLGIRALSISLNRMFQAPKLTETVGGLLIVTDIAPKPAKEAFVKQITEPPAPVPVVLADVTGLEQSSRLIEALRQVSYLPGQDYE